MKEKIILDRKTKIKILALTIAIILFAVMGVSYAYVSLNVTGNEEASSMKVDIAQLELTFTDGNVVNISGIFPGTTVTKTFSVTNNTSTATNYDIKMSDVFTTFTEDELVYTLSSTNSGATKTETIMPNNDGLIKAKVLIAGNTTQTYTMSITWKEKNDYQNYNSGATYHGKIQILSPYTYTNGVANNIKLVDRIMLDNTTAYPTNTSSKYVTASTGINYAKPSDHAYNGYYTYVQDASTIPGVTFTSSSNKTVTSVIPTYDSVSGMFTLSGTVGTQRFGSVSYSNDYIGYYTCNNNTSTCYTLNQEAYKILEVSGTTVTKVERYVARPDKTSWNGLGLYQTSTNTENNQPTYFFRGHVINNYVSFAGDIWRIIRINEDGSIRMIRQVSYASSQFNSSTNNAMYVGFMFGTSSDPYANTNSSIAKTKVDQYYTSKLTSYSSYLSDAGFCNDRSVNTVSGATTYYGARGRLTLTTKTPQFACPNESRDLFTTSSSSKGNKSLTYPIGLITEDEIAFAGSLYAKLSKNYLSMSITGNYRTMTPYANNASTAFVFYGGIGGFNSYTDVSSSQHIRPVISLKSDVLVTGGTGTVNDPYIITQ